MRETAADLARRLAEQAEAVCRHYLSNGRREGRYWIVGDVANTPGRSLYVRLDGGPSGRRAPGRWTDAATGEYGDLLDLIARSSNLCAFREIADEARHFLGLPHSALSPAPSLPSTSVPSGSPEAARRLFAMSRPIAGTLAEAYLHGRGIALLQETEALRFHPRCYHRRAEHSPPETWPAMIAAVTDLNGRITGVQRTWLAPEGCGKAPIESPRRAMGHLLGHGVRFGTALDVMAAGEGIETVVSLRQILPSMPMLAALSAAHLSGILFGPQLRRLYVARDNDPAGERACRTLVGRAEAAGIEAFVLSPTRGDFNDDLQQLGTEALRAAIRVQLAPQYVERFMAIAQ